MFSPLAFATVSLGAFADLSFLSSTGRLGPGFFPRIIGLILIVACVLTLAGDVRERRAEGGLWH